jgi:hypothetical protein
MSAGTAAFIIVMMSISTIGWLVNSWIRTKHNAPPSGAGQDGLEATRQIELLSTENSGLKGQVSRLEERIAVLERIATDPAERTARAIDNLR